MTFTQRFGGAFDLNIHLHMLVLNSVYVQRPDGGARFVPVPAQTSTELPRWVERLGYRVGRHLQRRGLLVRDAERTYLEWNSEQASTLDDLVSRQFVRYDSIASSAWARDTAGISFAILIRKG